MLVEIAKIFGLGVVAAINPLVFTMTLMFLGKPERPRTRVAAFLLGGLGIGLVVAVSGFFLGQATLDKAVPERIALIIDIIIGAVFIVLGVRAWLTSEPRFKVSDEAPRNLWRRLIIVGVLANLITFDDLIVVFAATRITGSLEAPGLDKVVLFVITLLFFLAPIYLPLLLTIIFPRAAKNVLPRINVFLEKYGQKLIAVIFLLMGIIFLYDGIKILFN